MSERVIDAADVAGVGLNAKNKWLALLTEAHRTRCDSLDG
jgi:hypothetical protein